MVSVAYKIFYDYNPYLEENPALGLSKVYDIPRDVDGFDADKVTRGENPYLRPLPDDPWWTEVEVNAERRRREAEGPQERRDDPHRNGRPRNNGRTPTPIAPSVPISARAMGLLEDGPKEKDGERRHWWHKLWLCGRCSCGRRR